MALLVYLRLGFSFFSPLHPSLPLIVVRPYAPTQPPSILSLCNYVNVMFVFIGSCHSTLAAALSQLGSIGLIFPGRVHGSLSWIESASEDGSPGSRPLKISCPGSKLRCSACLVHHFIDIAPNLSVTVNILGIQKKMKPQNQEVCVCVCPHQKPGFISLLITLRTQKSCCSFSLICTLK